MLHSVLFALRRVRVTVDYIGLVRVSLQVALGRWAELKLSFNPGKEYNLIADSRKTFTKPTDCRSHPMFYTYQSCIVLHLVVSTCIFCSMPVVFFTGVKYPVACEKKFIKDKLFDSMLINDHHVLGFTRWVSGAATAP